MSIDVNNVQRQAIDMASQFGRSLLHQMYPMDFEYYMMALELVDGSGTTLDYFAFPIMPSNIVKTETNRITIKKAYKSTLILTSPAYTPQDITIRGNFGKSFKILIEGREILSGVAYANSIKAGVFELYQNASTSILTSPKQFNHFVKTGYGATKIMQSIIHKSNGCDDVGPFRLYLYNFALGESYLVVAPSKALVLEQNDSTMNMIWNYTLNLTIIAPLDAVRTARGVTSIGRLLRANVIQGTINKVGRDTANYVKTTLLKKLRF